MTDGTDKTQDKYQRYMIEIGLINVVIVLLDIVGNGPPELLASNAAAAAVMILSGIWTQRTIHGWHLRWWHFGGVSMLFYAVATVVRLNGVETWPSELYSVLVGITAPLVLLSLGIDLFLGGGYIFPNMTEPETGRNHTSDRNHG